MSKSEKEKRATISVVTATRNAVEHLPKLIGSLRGQTDKDFEWVVADGASDDGTLELLRSVTGINLVISSQADFGIYDALNRAIDLASGEYYVVAGGDDIFHADAIENFRVAMSRSHADIIAANYLFASRKVGVKKGPSWLFGQSAFIAGHTLATAFKKDLHERFGKYSGEFPIGGDQFFVITAGRGGAKIHEADFVAGEMGAAGVSSVDRIGVALEFFRVQLAVRSSLLVQFPLLVLRLLRIVLFERRR